MGTSSGQRKIESVRTVFRILEQLADRDGAGVTELAAEVGVAKSTIHDHLSTLREMGYVIRKDEQYYLSLRFLNFGRYVRNRTNLYESIEEDIQRIADETKLRTQFIAREETLGIPLVYASGKEGMPYIGFDIGEPLSLHATASGKAILAHLPEDDTKDILDPELEQFTEQTITDTDEIREELEMVREQGYAFNRGESFSGLLAVGVPVRDKNERVVGSISVAGPRNQLQGEFFRDELPQMLKGYVNEIELKLRHL